VSTFLEMIGYAALWWVWQDTLSGRGPVVDFVRSFTAPTLHHEGPTND
jgi:hypothetical protein